MEGLKLSSFLFCLLISFDFINGNCPRNTEANRAQFGQNCNYVCRCEDRSEQCDQLTGECPSQKCQKNWMGSACQYFRIGFNETDQTLDYKEGTCVQVSSPKDINLGTVYPFNSVTVVFGGPGTRINICVRRQSSNEWGSCVNTAELTTDTIHAVFRNFVQAQYVRLKFDGSSQNICEIKINTAGRNLAYGQQASQSSNSSDIAGVGTAMNAVDSLGGGETGTDERCIHTNEEVNPWWRVDLGSSYKILLFRVFNWRGSATADRFVNFTLSLSNSSGENDLVEVYRDRRTTLAGAEHPILVSNIDILLGRYVHVTRPGNLNAALSFCEILIYGECPDNTCGFTCNEMCYCKVASYVDRLKGLCFDGCQSGWTGDGYKCNKKCAAGKYGDNCLLHCGNCSIFPCNHVDGKCTDDKCGAGYRGDYCKQPCAAGKYGHNCLLDCGNCSISPCNRVDGRCTDDKCAAGYAEPNCKQPCAAGKYGDNCSQECGSCSISPCNHVDGNCIDDKCEAGYRGIYCKQPCAAGKYGDNCSQECGNCRIIPCNRMDGKCSDDKCKAGYRGDYCKQPCAPGKYGYNCLLECGYCNITPCNHVDGLCTDDECGAAGYRGPYCKQHETQTDPKEQSTSTPAFVGGVVAAVLVVICGVITFVILRRRKRLCESPIYEDTNRNNDEHQYYEIGNKHAQCTTGSASDKGGIAETNEGIATTKGELYENTTLDMDKNNSAHQNSILKETLGQLE